MEKAAIEAWEETELKPAQESVEDVISPFKPKILKLLPGAKLKYRGSLATGSKHGNNLSASGGVLKFNEQSPGKKPGFDCDFFIEVSDQDWATIARQANLEQHKRKAFVSELSGWQHRGALRTIENEIAVALANVSGYRKDSNDDDIGDFSIVVQSTAESGRQISRGRAYPVGAIGKEYPAYESSLPNGTMVSDDDDFFASGTPAKIAPEIHREI